MPSLKSLPIILGLTLAVFFALFAGFPLGLSPALAQQPDSADAAPGPERIDRRLTAGGYDLFIEGEASNLSLGTALFSIAVLNAATGQPIPDARVVIRTAHQGYGEEGWASALSIPERPEIYRARMKLDYPGVWNVSVDVDGPLGRVETEVGSVTIPEPRQYLAGTLVFAGMSAFLLCGLAYVVWSIRRSQRRRQLNQETGNAA